MNKLYAWTKHRTVDPGKIYSCADPKFKAWTERRDGPVVSNRVDYGRRSCSNATNTACPKPCRKEGPVFGTGRKENSVSLQATPLSSILLTFLTIWELSYHAQLVLMDFAVTLPLTSSHLNPRIFTMYLQIIQQVTRSSTFLSLYTLTEIYFTYT